VYFNGAPAVFLGVAPLKYTCGSVGASTVPPAAVVIAAAAVSLLCLLIPGGWC
jgi:hypothetical protein